MVHLWPEQELHTDALSNVGYEYSDAEEPDTPIDHITCHSDGTFQLKTKNEANLYVQHLARTEPLGPDTKTFLELNLIGDLVDRYPIMAEKVKYHHVWIDMPPNSSISLRGMFSGINYALENDMAATHAQLSDVFGGTRLVSGTVKGLLLGRPQVMTHEARMARPRGTILSFEFPVGEERWRIKAMLFL